MTTRVYRYGCKRPMLDTRNAIDEQLYLAHRYRLMLWHLACASRAQYRARRREHFPELIRVEDELARQMEIAKLLIEDKEVPLSRPEKLALKVEQQRLKARVRELRAMAKESSALAADVAADREREGVLQRALRNVYSRVYGLYSGSYLCVEDAARRARAGSRDPVCPRWDGAFTHDFDGRRRLGDVHGSGVLGIQLQGGRTVSELVGGSDPSVELILQGGKRAIFRYRLRSAERGRAVLIDLPIVYHRPLPSDAKITWAKLVVQRSGLRTLYSVQLTVESSANARTEYGAGVVAVCLHNDRIMWSCEYGVPQELVHDLRSQRGAELQSNRDKLRNEVAGMLMAWGERQDELPDWLRDELARQEDRPSARRLARFVTDAWPHFDDSLRHRLTQFYWEPSALHGQGRWVSYVERENHLYGWHADMRTSALRRRKNAYRVFAAQLRRRFNTLVIDNRELSSPDRLCRERRDKCIHELRLALKGAFGEDVFAAKGMSCAELCERFRAEQTAEAAREGDSNSGIAHLRGLSADSSEERPADIGVVL